VDELKFQMTRLVPEYTPRIKEVKPQKAAWPKASLSAGYVNEDTSGPLPPEKSNLAQSEFL